GMTIVFFFFSISNSLCLSTGKHLRVPGIDNSRKQYETRLGGRDSLFLTSIVIKKVIKIYNAI
ncbi:MAG TPA: hypothetical protein VIM41_09680, partial [Gammaproteobacteria bacterium]